MLWNCVVKVIVAEMSGLWFDSVGFVVGDACGMVLGFRFFDRVWLAEIREVNVWCGLVL